MVISNPGYKANLFALLSENIAQGVAQRLGLPVAPQAALSVEPVLVRVNRI
ncbi:MAG TPA: hypothetical protein PK299_15825 [Anaerolineales bacterium]|nr:hypothetical protein [Anaerolineales bacterium]